MNFLNFIKEESKRNIDKLYNATSNRLKNMQLKDQLNITNPFINFIKDNKIEVTIDNMNNNNSNGIENFNEKNKKNNFDFNKILTSKIGLTNLGLTCYMNSSLQIMMHTDIFIEKILQYKKPYIDNLTNKFIDLVDDIISIEFNNKNEYILESFSPVLFRKKFIYLHSNFSSGQQDSIEFIRIFLDDISRETNKSFSDYKELILDEDSKDELSMKYNNYYKSRENSIITDIYYTQMINIFTCNCGNETYSFQKILDIPLLINNNQKEITIEALIDNFLKEILVDLNDRCSKCKKIKKKYKKIY